VKRCFVILRVLCVFVALAATLAGQGPPADLVPLQIIVSSSSAEAAGLRQQVSAGGDFAAIAREKSIDPTARDGGYLGKMSVASLRPELRDALTGIRAGEMTVVVRIPTGYAVLRVVPESEATVAVGDDPSRTLAASATGATRDAIPVAGLIEADTIFRNTAPAGEPWAEDIAQMCRIRTESMRNVLGRLETMLGPGGIASDSSRATPSEVFEARYALAQLHAYTGDLAKAVGWWTQAEKTVAEYPAPGPQIYHKICVPLRQKNHI
jgi:hypothetical protein